MKTPSGKIAGNLNARYIFLGCIETLETDFREVLILKDIKGFSYDEISDMLSIAQRTVKSRLFRAREYMKNAY